MNLPDIQKIKRKFKKPILRGFSLIELMIVVSIIATISAILVLVINPVEYLRRGRDAQRLRDNTLINQAINLYSYSAAIQYSNDPDLDGPSYSQSCKGESNPKLFVSVPSDNGESDPTPPEGWTYERAESSPLRLINGDGWVPVDFSSISDSIRPINILPVDPVNTFGSGFYYTYTCGSFEMNLKFESEAYKELAANDGGDDPVVFELGDVLTTAPYQEAYHTSTDTGPATGTIVLYPDGSGNSNNWAGSYSDVDEDINSPNDSDYVRADNKNLTQLFSVDDPTPSGNITNVRMSLRAKQATFGDELIEPTIYACDGATCNSYNASTILPGFSIFTSYVDGGQWANNPETGAPWLWSDINNLQVGFKSIASGGWGGPIDVSQVYIEVDFEN